MRNEITVFGVLFFVIAFIGGFAVGVNVIQGDGQFDYYQYVGQTCEKENIGFMCRYKRNDNDWSGDADSSCGGDAFGPINLSSNEAGEGNIIRGVNPPSGACCKDRPRVGNTHLDSLPSNPDPCH